MASLAEKPQAAGAVSAELVERNSAPLFNYYHRIATAAEVLGDLCAASFGITASYLIYQALHLGKQLVYPMDLVLGGAIVYAALFVIMLNGAGAYREGHGLLRIRETERALRVAVQSILLVWPATFLAARLVSRWVFGIALILVPLAVVTEKQLLLLITTSLHTLGVGVRRVVIFGAGFTGRKIFSALTRSPKVGLVPVAMLDESPLLKGQVVHAFGYRREHSIRVDVRAITPDVLRSYKADLLVIAVPGLERNKFSNTVAAAAQAGAKVAFVPGSSIASDAWIDYADIDGVMIASLGKPAGRFIYETSKRIFDLGVSCALVAIGAPVLLAIAFAVRLDSPGPVFFKQKRVGKNGALFDMYKFRSMLVDAPKYAVSPTTTEDPRITRIGRYLRKTSFDELPQLFNVIRGEMSLVGPRPEMPFVVESYGSRERQRLGVVPGITGFWQLSADRAYPIHESIQYDLYYIRERGFFMDIAILLHTALFAMKGV